MSTQLAETKNTLKSLINSPQYQNRFKEVLGTRAPQFVSSVLSVGGLLGADCDPTSIIASAMTAATLDLPVDKNLGFAWIVPYKKSGAKLGQFQMGYKGYIQLALRTGQYQRMNARVINVEAFKGWDEVGEPIIDWAEVDESKETAGYAFAFKLVNGFTKVAFWPKKRVEEHAKRYSQSFRGGYDSPWKSNFDQMALKTVVKNELAKWGIMSIQMENAFRHDQAVKRSPDAEPEFVDGNVEIEKPVFGTVVEPEPQSETKPEKAKNKEKATAPEKKEESPLDVPKGENEKIIFERLEAAGYKPELLVEAAVDNRWVEPHQRDISKWGEEKCAECVENWDGILSVLKSKFNK